jgi:hypothetical protein
LKPVNSVVLQLIMPISKGLFDLHTKWCEGYSSII